MKRTLTAAISREEDWYVARCIEVEVASQGKTEAEALANLTEALELYFDNDGPPSIPEPHVIKQVVLEV